MRPLLSLALRGKKEVSYHYVSKVKSALPFVQLPFSIVGFENHLQAKHDLNKRQTKRKYKEFRASGLHRFWLDPARDTWD
ncbi:hypothetical protein HNR42_003496 [Deinobacterium chartae]|uniref:Uncharacterized protein n=1 Tax=Deinobacterium chartae TaxID=521158 RepID=A0A841I2I7_9DEIO|nr:hypothetical protein [Deinobacterium chartae]MBB6100031.1 hypothetical protein [Deinobacterium chartae]